MEKWLRAHVLQSNPLGMITMFVLLHNTSPIQSLQPLLSIFTAVALVQVTIPLALLPPLFIVTAS